MDKTWMDDRNRLSLKYINGIKSFIAIAKNYLIEQGKTRCPCRKCINVYYHDIEIVDSHLWSNGMASNYKVWIHHGEKYLFHPTHSSVSDAQSFEIVDDDDDDDDDNEALHHMLTDLGQGEGMSNIPDEGERAGKSSRNTDSYQGIFQALNEELYSGCKKLSSFEFLVKLMHLKVLHHWSNASFNMLLKLLKDILPEGAKIPESYYHAKRKLSELGLGYESIHVCKYDCALFWKENANAENCPVCHEPRYKQVKETGKNIPHKTLRYFPLKPRLQRLFLSSYTAKDMRWHREKRADIDGELRHPADAEAWKDLDQRYPEFGKESRNVRLGLASDGFNPFGNQNLSYSTWPVILVPYNMPMWKCMKPTSFMLTLLIPGKKSPGKDMDIFLRPLIDELKELWDVGAESYDVHGKEYFYMRAALLWTINDFPAYANLSGWSTKGYLACPVCNKDTCSLRLTNKICYMGHRRWLDEGHPWRKSLMHDGQRDMTSRPPKEFTGDDILEQLNLLPEVKPGKHPNNKDKKRKRTVEELNWTTKSIFFELEYWSNNKLRHNLDVMHIEKNICDSVLGTLMSDVNKSKDTAKARIDLKKLRFRKELYPFKNQRGDWVKPRACYALTTQERKEFCTFLESVKFPDGYAANISRNVSTIDGKITGLKSHDCHVMFQRLLPIGMRKYLSKDVCTALVEFSNFFRQLCARTLLVKDLEKMEKDIVIILCKLERIFPPAFFDIMVHLAVHLPREAIYGGPVHARWMYPPERWMKILKQFVTNKARPEGSIAEGYVVNEALTFCSMYLSGIETRFNREERNDEGSQYSCQAGSLSVFNQKYRMLGHMDVQFMSREDKDIAHLYILNNCDEIEAYFTEHMMELQQKYPRGNLARKQQQEFPDWFQKHMRLLQEQNSTLAIRELGALSIGFDVRVKLYRTCIVNGVRFQTISRDNHLTTQNSGVFIHGDDGNNFYGKLINILELDYLYGFRVCLFKCEWFDTDPRKKRIKEDFGFTCINVGNLCYQNEPFVFANQAQQIFYVDDTKNGADWKVVQHVQQRNIWDMPDKSFTEEDIEEQCSIDNAFQEIESSNIRLNVQEDMNEDDFEYTKGIVDSEADEEVIYINEEDFVDYGHECSDVHSTDENESIDDDSIADEDDIDTD